MATSPKRISLSTELFTTALANYIDYFKPDPLSKKQLENWSLEWVEKKDSSDASLTGNPANVLEGCLQIGGDNLVVSLQTVCSWTPDISNEKHGSLYFSCHASARFWSLEEYSKRRDEITTTNHHQEKESHKKVQNKIREKVAAKLENDGYISKLLTTESKKEEKNAFQLLAEAKIQSSVTNLEERVFVSEDVCEGIKRAIWSSAETPLDVIELILQFPCLPTLEHNNNNNNNNNKSSTGLEVVTPLANRAKLRLLEDAMCDACEKEGEDEMVGELKLSDDDGNDGEKRQTQTAPPHHSNNKNSQSMPRKRQKNNKGER